ncbi:MAG: leucine-rich repeat domain-containing protein [Hominilimicola sp.]
MFTKDAAELIQYPIGNRRTEYKIPDGVTSIGEEAFSWSSLKRVTVPDSVTSIGRYAFSWSSLTSINIPDSVTSIGKYAFFVCDKLPAKTRQIIEKITEEAEQKRLADEKKVKSPESLYCRIAKICRRLWNTEKGRGAGSKKL